MAKLSEIAMERKREKERETDGMFTIYQLVQDFATIHRKKLTWKPWDFPMNYGNYGIFT
jgi:hypothetical protein